MGEVTSLYLVVALLVGGGLGPSIWGWWNKTKEIPLSVAHLTQGLLLVLPISNLLGSRGVALLLSLLIQSLASIMLPLCWDSPFHGWYGLIDHVAFAPQSLQAGFVWPKTTRVERWWIPSIVVAMAIGLANLIFCYQKSKGGWYRKIKYEGCEGIACNDSKTCWRREGQSNKDG
jgi:hypothetical protein